MKKENFHKKNNRFLKNILEYIAFMILASIARGLPRTAALTLGKYLGVLSQHLLPKRTRTATENMRRAFPDMPPQELEKNIRKTFEHLGISGMEMLQLDQFKGQRDLETYFSFTGLEHLKEAYDMNRGVFLLTGHVGFWEVGTYFLPQLGYPVDFVAKRMKNPYVDKFFTRLREAGGGYCLESKRGARKIIRSLSQKRGVAILLDQHITPKEAVKVDFFGRPACTTPIIAQMAMKQGIPIVPVFVYRTENYHYDVIIEPVIHLDSDFSDDAVTKNTALLTSIIEKAVRKDITQWFWVHRRWRD